MITRNNTDCNCLKSHFISEFNHKFDQLESFIAISVLRFRDEN